MSKKNFKVGDRVVGKGYMTGTNIDGMTGRIICEYINGPLFDYGVEFDNECKYFHKCEGKGKYGHCYWVTTDHIELLEPKNETIVIYREGDKVIALDKRTNKKATTRCHPDDTFDFEVGAKIAFDRLLGKEEPKLYNGKFVVIDDHGADYTNGKIYEVKDGRWYTNCNILIPTVQKPCETFEDVKGICVAKIIEVVE